MSKQNRPLLSLVIPALNEARRLPRTLESIAKHRQVWDFSFELLVVVEPGRDQTLEVAQAAARSWPEVSVITYPQQRGKGFAVRTGMRRASGDFVFFTDADLSTPLEDLDLALGLFRQYPEMDVLVGSRQHPGSKILLRQSALRELMGQTFNRLMQSLAGLRIADTQCGFKGFRRQAAEQIFQRQTINGFSFDVEVLLLAEAMHFTVREMPVRWSNSAESRVRVMTDSLQMLRDLVRVRRIVRWTMQTHPWHAPGADVLVRDSRA